MLKFDEHSGIFENEGKKYRLKVKQEKMDTTVCTCEFEPMPLNKLELLLFEVFESDKSISELKFCINAACKEKTNEPSQCVKSEIEAAEKTVIGAEQVDPLKKQNMISVQKSASRQEILEAISKQLVLGA